MQLGIGTYRIRCEVGHGLTPLERVAHIATSSGELEEVAVPASLADSSTIEASLIGTKDSDALIELPRESATGRWRVWVPTSSLVAESP
jgi:hypothetical protein